jgi:hypothetical protein
MSICLIRTFFLGFKMNHSLLIKIRVTFWLSLFERIVAISIKSRAHVTGLIYAFMELFDIHTLQLFLKIIQV